MTIRNTFAMTMDINKAVIDLCQANNYIARDNKKRTKENISSALDHIKEFVGELDMELEYKHVRRRRRL